ncbi:MAG: DUF305 domain-containing protein [Bacteroidetes bacterium]|nr:MAG: DUF305 domain-containing protein [Bacteroidota bacterium]
MKILLIVGLVISSAWLIQSCNSSSTSENKSSLDSAKQANKETKPVAKDASDFAMNAAVGGMLEVESGKLASRRAVNPRVKEFGQMMVKDHSAANEKLKSLASTLNIALPDSVSADDRKQITKLALKKGKDFDKAYMNMMVNDHEKDVAEFRKAADNLSDSTIKDFATRTLPTLEMHLDSAKAIAKK